MKYAVVFEQGPTSVGAMVPDLPGCFAIAPNLSEARTMVAEAIEFHIRCLREAGDVVPDHRATPKMSTSRPDVA